MSKFMEIYESIKESQTTQKERREILKYDEGFVTLVKGYNKSKYNFESYFKGTNFRKDDVEWALKNKIWELEKNKKYFS